MSTLPDRNVLLRDYETDIQRRLELVAASSPGSFGSTDRANRFLVSEIAQLKLQITELELASFGRDRTGTAGELAPTIDHVWPSMPTYDAGSHISIGAGVMTFGFHFPEVGHDGTVQRWSGPSTHSGLVALIERSRPLFAELSSVTFIDPSVEITRVRVDGEEAQFAWTADKSLKFLIPPIEESRGPMTTQIAFAVNKCLVVQDVQPQYADNRSVGFCTFGLKLSADAS